MSTRRFMSRICKNPGRFAFAMLVGILLALQCLLPSAAFARSGSGGQMAAFSPPTLQDLYVRDKVGVSVVRLVATYGGDTSDVHQICTGLGVLVASKLNQGSSTTYQNWVLTDGSLVRSGMTKCGLTGSSLALSDIQIWANNEYANSSNTLLDHLTGCSSVGDIVTCLDGPSAVSEHVFTPTVTAQGSYTLFSFQSNAGEPHLLMASNRTATRNPIVNVGLTNRASNGGQIGQVYPNKTVQESQPFKNYLMPDIVPSPAATPNGSQSSQPIPAAVNPIEGGTPEVNAGGELVGMFVNVGSGSYMPLELPVLQAISGTIGLSSAGPVSSPQACSVGTLVGSCWDAGIDAFYGPPPAAPNRTLAGSYFDKLSSLNRQFIAPQTFAAQAKQNPPPSSSTSTRLKSDSSSAPGITSLWWTVLLIVGLVVLVVVLVLMMLLVGRRRKRLRELERFAAEQAEAQRLAEAEVQRQRSQQQQVSEVPCPNCRNMVRLTDTICPFCRFPLSPTASGLGVRLMGTSPLPPLTPPISEQPTVQILPAPAASPPSGPGDTTAKRQKPVPEEVTVHNFQQVRGRNLSLAVGTRSDPGIKRKYKPNEDSLFAMQGARTHNSQPQQFGLFVVADGMGGHANGQDASRLAIQTMIDFMLPKVSTSEQLDDEAFIKLLETGVQNANQAVHNHNLGTHADMGTTMTTALVVGSVAYVANVGDSRTYLYREDQGLSKVTHDHSVVASLVDAGIIKPDDIYTHPKRNQIYRSLGEKPVVEVDTFRVDLQPGDKLLLCSDGLWDMVRDPLIQQVLSKSIRDPNKTGQELIKAALEGGGEDNISVIVIQFSEANERTGMTGVQLLAKPETVTVPNLPPL